MMKVRCTKCEQNLEVSADLLGQQVRCPKCEFVVDLVASVESPANLNERDSLERETVSSPEFTTKDQTADLVTESSDRVACGEGHTELSDSVSRELIDDEEKKRELPQPTEWLLRIPEGFDFGPVGRAGLDEWVSQGRVATDCKIRNESVDWMPALDFYPLPSPSLTI